MPMNLQIIHARDFVRTTSTGQLDWEKSKELFAATAKVAARLEKCEILLDLRQVESSTLTDTQVWHLVQLLYDYDPVFREKTALLIPPDAPGDRARFFQLCAINRGFHVKVFNDFEQAVNWLMSATEVTLAE